MSDTQTRECGCFGLKGDVCILDKSAADWHLETMLSEVCKHEVLIEPTQSAWRASNLPFLGQLSAEIMYELLRGGYAYGVILNF